MINKIAGVITTFARPEYLNKCLTSLEKAEGQNEIDWYVFQDGLKNPPEGKVGYFGIDPNNVEENIDIVVDSKLNIKEVDIEEVNRGINYQMNKAFSLFDDYETIFFFEDDIIISKYYLKLLERCSIQHPEAVASFFSIGMDNPSKKDFSILIRSTRPRLWGFYMTRVIWERLKGDWYKKYDPEINKRTPYYDVILTQLIRKHSKGKYEPLVTRARNVGIKGVLSTNETSWKHRHLHNQKEKIEYRRDANIKDFILRPKRRGR